VRRDIAVLDGQLAGRSHALSEDRLHPGALAQQPRTGGQSFDV
jgi:hypothetical protein